MRWGLLRGVILVVLSLATFNWPFSLPGLTFRNSPIYVQFSKSFIELSTVLEEWVLLVPKRS